MPGRGGIGLHLARHDRLLGFVCVMCRVQMDMAVTYDCDHADDCPGWVEPAEGELTSEHRATTPRNDGEMSQPAEREHQDPEPRPGLRLAESMPLADALAEYVAELVEQAPPLAPEIRAHLAGLLNGEAG